MKRSFTQPILKTIFPFFIIQYNKALNDSPAMNQIEKINRDKDKRATASTGKKVGNAKSANSGDSNKNIDPKYTKFLEDGGHGKKKSSTTNEEKSVDPTSDVLAASR